MRQSFVVAGAVVGAFLLGGVAGGVIGHSALSSSSTTSTTVASTATTSSSATTAQTSPTTTGISGTSATIGSNGDTFPISVSPELSVPQTDAETNDVIEPSSCTYSDSVVTAKGTIDQARYDEALVRAGDVIELYVFSGDPNNPIQLAALSKETPGQLGNWIAVAPIAPDFAAQISQATYCAVALQSTHAFMLAGSAG